MSHQSAHKLITATITLSEILHLDPEIQELLVTPNSEERIVELLRQRYGNGENLNVQVTKNKAEFKWILQNIDREAENFHKEALESARKKEFQNAITKWTQAVSNNPNDPDYYYNLGLAFFENKNYREAVENLRQAVSVCPIYHRAHLILGTILLKTRKFEDAEKHLKESIYFNPRNALAYLNLGAVYSILKKYKDAIASFQRTIELSPREVRAYFGLAKIHSILGDHENANFNYRKVIELDQKGNLAAHAKRGIASSQEAQESHTQLDTVEIEDLETLFSEGFKSFLYTDYHYAAKMYQKYLEKKPNDDQVWSALGVVLQRVGALDRAVEAFSQASRLSSGKALYLKQLGITYDFLDRPDDAVTALETATELGKHDSVTLATLGKNLIKLNRITEAIPHLEQSIKLNKANLLGHINLASALVKMGEAERAASHLEIVLSAKVNTPLKEEANALLKKMRS